VITFELEAIPDESLELLRAAESRGEIRVHPSIETLARFKDKGNQKAWLQAVGLPTLPSLTVHGGEIPEALRDGRWALPVVQKAHRGGYDGKGVQLLRSEADLERLWDIPSYLEPALSPCRELSVVVARDVHGNLAAFPPVSMTFDPRYNAVFSVSSPARASEPLVREADRIAREAVGRLSTPGVFAVELFIDPQDQVTINEISPRVHNSGHLTIEGFEASQFDQHVRAVMGMPLAPIAPRAPAAEMFNLLYDEGFRSACPSEPGRVDTGDAVVHWYGKSTGQEGRKMGHITATGKHGDAVLAAAERAYLDLYETGRQPAVLPYKD
jgi:5-(carboxyamino)imidazole ribonucleotide synthase